MNLVHLHLSQVGHEELHAIDAKKALFVCLVRNARCCSGIPVVLDRAFGAFYAGKRDGFHCGLDRAREPSLSTFGSKAVWIGLGILS